MERTDLAYYERRLEQELAEAERSDRQDVRQVHQRLADLYRIRIELLASGSLSSTHELEVSAVQAIMNRA